MAQITCGVTASWGGTVFGTVVELRATFGGSLPQNRGGTSTASFNSAWSVDAGTIEVLCLSTANIKLDEWGKKRVFAMGGTAFIGNATAGATRPVSFTTKAILQTIQAGAKVNDVWRFQGTFKVVKENP